MFSCYTFSAMKYLAVLCLAVAMFTQPYNCATKNERDTANNTCSAFTLEDNSKAETKTDTPNARSPRWYASSEWWLVIIAALTGLAIAYQAREMTRATDVMQGQMVEMQKSRELENKTLVLQYRPKIIVRNAKALQFSFELGEPGECKMRFVMVNTGGSPAHITPGGFIQLMSATASKLGKVEIKQGDPVYISQFTLQPGQIVTVEEVLPTGTINSIAWANFREGIQGEHPRYLYLLGTVFYMDELSIPRATGIHRKYNPKTQEFEPQKDNESEYTD